MPSSTGTGAGSYQATECFAPINGDCPDQYHAIEHIIPTNGCDYVQSVDCGPMVLDSDKCCYRVTEQPQGCEGRPFRVEGESRIAWPEIRDRGWSEADSCR